MSTDITELMKQANIAEHKLGNIGSAFLSYKINGRWVYVEIIAPNLAEHLLQMSVEQQCDLIAVMLNLVTEVGDHEILTDRGQNRGARIIRMKSEEDKNINLLITR